MIRRAALTRGAVKRTDEKDFDRRLNIAMNNIRSKCSEDWALATDYLHSLIFLQEFDGSSPDVINAEYHKQSTVMKIIKKLNGTKEI